MAPFTHDRTSYGSRNDTRCIESGKSLGGVGVENRTDGNPITATMTVFTDSTFLGVANQTLRPCPHLPAGPPNAAPPVLECPVCGTSRHVAGFCFLSSPRSAPYLLRIFSVARFHFLSALSSRSPIYALFGITIVSLNTLLQTDFSEHTDSIVQSFHGFFDAGTLLVVRMPLWFDLVFDHDQTMSNCRPASPYC